MTAKELADRLDSGSAPQVVDVRTRREFLRGHLPGAMNVPFWQLGSLQLAYDQSSRVGILLCCEHGPRAWIAGLLLRLTGTRRIDYLRGHMAGWKRSGRPLNRE